MNTSERCCKKVWESKHSCSYHSGTELRYKKACEHLEFPKGIDFVEECIYESHSSSSDTDEKELNRDDGVEEIKLKRVESSNNNSMSSLSSSSKSTSNRGAYFN